MMASIIAVSLVLAACDTTPALRPFTTDGCSWFPDRSPIGKADWSHCCVCHDVAYWRGGTQQERLAADAALKQCVKASTNGDALSELMYGGVRAGGVPYTSTSFRWGYGWPYDRGYDELAWNQKEQADALLKEYLDHNPGLQCPGTVR